MATFEQLLDGYERWHQPILANADNHVCTRAAHVNHDYTDKQFLAVLCPSCHAKNDTPQRIAMTRRDLGATAAWAVLVE